MLLKVSLRSCPLKGVVAYFTERKVGRRQKRAAYLKDAVNTYNHFVYEDTKRPPVYRGSMALGCDNLRCNVLCVCEEY